jgi:hypothetical protein
MNKHDDHYKDFEPIEIMEQIVDRVEVPTKAALSVAYAFKYLSRCGLKDHWSVDVEKAINFLTRALTGEWYGENEPKTNVCQCDCYGKIEQLRIEAYRATKVSPDNEYLEGRLKAMDEILQLLKEPK